MPLFHNGAVLLDIRCLRRTGCFGFDFELSALLNSGLTRVARNVSIPAANGHISSQYRNRPPGQVIRQLATNRP
jgi:hypothetical protein